jgi:hypothetical protein
MRKGKDVHNRGSASGRSQNVKFFKNRLTAQDVHYFRMEGVLLIFKHAKKQLILLFAGAQPPVGMWPMHVGD